MDDFGGELCPLFQFAYEQCEDGLDKLLGGRGGVVGGQEVGDEHNGVGLAQVVEHEPVEHCRHTEQDPWLEGVAVLGKEEHEVVGDHVPHVDPENEDVVVELAQVVGVEQEHVQAALGHLLYLLLRLAIQFPDHLRVGLLQDLLERKVTADQLLLPHRRVVQARAHEYVLPRHHELLHLLQVSLHRLFIMCCY